MKILYFSKGYTVHDHRFLSALNQTEHELRFLKMQASPVDPVLPPVPERIRVQVLQEINRDRGGEHSSPSPLDQLREILKEMSPDVIHAGPVQPPAYLASLTGFSPLLTMSWGSDLLMDAQQGEARELARSTLFRTSVFLGDCQTVADEAVKLGMPEDRIVIFPWGVSLEKFSHPPTENIRHELGWDDCFVLISTRSLEPLYGAEILFKGFIQAASGDSRLRLLVLGQGSLGDSLFQLLEKHDLVDRVRFLGKVAPDKMPDYYKAADLYVSASRVDGSSISLLQAMASGLPSLVSDIPGNREWIEEGRSGWLFADGDSETFSATLHRVIQNESSLIEMGRYGRSIAETRANWQENFPRLLQAYELAYSRPRVTQ